MTFPPAPAALLPAAGDLLRCDRGERHCQSKQAFPVGSLKPSSPLLASPVRSTTMVAQRANVGSWQTPTFGNPGGNDGFVPDQVLPPFPEA